MLGRLRMSITDCISTYSNLGGEVFGKKQPFYLLGQNKYDCTKLERIIRDVAKSNSRNPRNDPLMADTSVLNRSHQSRQERVQNRCIPCRVYVSDIDSGVQVLMGIQWRVCRAKRCGFESSHVSIIFQPNASEC